MVNFMFLCERGSSVQDSFTVVVIVSVISWLKLKTLKVTSTKQTSLL